jgi:LacI family transcriptional regulator
MRRQSHRPRIYFGLALIQSHFRRILAGGTAYIAAQKVPWEILDSWVQPEAEGVGQVDAAILQGGYGSARAQMRDQHLPWVQIAASKQPEPDEIAVLPDNRAIGRVAAEHLLERGFRAFAFSGSPDHWGSWERRDGFLQAIAPHPCRVFTGREKSFTRWAAECPPGTALFCENDITARFSIGLLRDAGRAIPEEVAVVGVDDDALVSSQSDVPISSVDPRSEAIGWRAAEVVADLMRGRKPRSRIERVPPGPVIVRRSSDILSIADPVLASALSKIREQGCAGLTVARLLRQVPESRRTLERKFHDHLGRGLEAEIRRVRIERGKELLATTELPVGDVADRAGFCDIFHFSAAFRKATGVPPRAWRTANRRTRGVGDR